MRLFAPQNVDFLSIFGIFNIKNTVKFYLEVCVKLEKLRIPYMVSGSMAMTYYTTPRMTRDIDIVIHLQSSDLDS